MKCYSCLQNLSILSYIESKRYYCNNSACYKTALIWFDLNNNLSNYAFFYQFNDSIFGIHGTLRINETDLFIRMTNSNNLILKTSFIPIQLDDLPNDIPKLFNRLLKLRAFS